jgi:uncharacterized protein involved in exopolysaccharide biosynthesis
MVRLDLVLKEWTMGLYAPTRLMNHVINMMIQILGSVTIAQRMIQKIQLIQTNQQSLNGLIPKIKGFFHGEIYITRQ